MKAWAAALVLAAASSASLFPSASLVYFGRTSLVVGDRWLFVDGGSLGYLPDPQDPANQKTLTATRVIDLSRSWTNASIPHYLVKRPGELATVAANALFYDQRSNRIYSSGGSPYAYFANASDYRIAPGWQMTSAWRPDAGAKYVQSAYWIRWRAAGNDINTGVRQSLDVDTPDALYRLGGLRINAVHKNVGARGMSKFDKRRRFWSIIDGPRSQIDLRWGGSGVYLPGYGDMGVLLFMGGLVAPAREVTQLHFGEDYGMKQMLIYDIAAGSFLTQNTTGDTSGPEVWEQCAVVAEDANGGGYDIFVFGGITNFTSITDTDSSSAVYVLSIPSFRWRKVEGSTQSWFRYDLACEVGGKRQMVMVGGISALKGNQTDPWTNNVNVFDMSALRWASRYDAHARPYVRHPSLAAAAKQHPYPEWTSPSLARIFGDGGSNELSGGAIAGIVVGSVAGVALLGAAAWYCLRRRRRAAARYDEKTRTAELDAASNGVERQWPEADGKPVGELEGTALKEADGTAVAELAQPETKDKGAVDVAAAPVAREPVRFELEGNNTMDEALEGDTPTSERFVTLPITLTGTETGSTPQQGRAP